MMNGSSSNDLTPIQIQNAPLHMSEGPEPLTNAALQYIGAEKRESLIQYAHFQC